MKVKGWGEKMKNREQWRRIVQEAKAHPELKRRGEGRKDSLPLRVITEHHKHLITLSSIEMIYGKTDKNDDQEGN
jgi:hypothetical protein